MMKNSFSQAPNNSGRRLGKGSPSLSYKALAKRAGAQTAASARTNLHDKRHICYLDLYLFHVTLFFCGDGGML